MPSAKTSVAVIGAFTFFGGFVAEQFHTPVLGQIRQAEPNTSGTSFEYTCFGLPRPIPQKVNKTKPPTLVAIKAHRALDVESNWNLEGTLAEIAKEMQRQTGVAVMIDRDQLVAYGLNDAIELKIDESKIPLRSMLRKTLRPHGLRAVVEDEGIVIQPHFGVLTVRGLATDRWVNVDEAAATKIDEALNTRVSLEIVEEPLDSFVRYVSDAVGIQIRVDRRGLDDLGLTPDLPVTAKVAEVSLYSGLKTVLDDLGLVLTIIDDVLMVTTTEASERRMLIRCYFVEGLLDDSKETPEYDPLMTVIQSNMKDVWNNRGGPGSMCPYTGKRQTLAVSAPYTAHREIERFLAALRGCPVSPPKDTRLIEVSVINNPFDAEPLPEDYRLPDRPPVRNPFGD